jgi:hypothetical protein
MQFIRVYLFVFVNVDLFMMNIWSKHVVILRNKNNYFAVISTTSLNVVDGS